MSDHQTLEEKVNASPAPVDERNVASEENGDAKRAKRVRIIRIAVLLLLLIGAFTLWRILRGPDVPANVVVLSGRIEGDDSAIASKTSGRILEIRFREGDHVQRGDVIALLDDEQIRARENQAQATVQQAQARVSSSRQQIAVLDQQLLTESIAGSSIER